MKKYTIITAVIMPLIATLAFWFYKGCTISRSLLWAAIPALVMSGCVIHAGCVYRRQTACNTRVLTLCDKMSIWFYQVMVILPLAWVGFCTLFGLMPLSTIIVFLTLPVAIACSRTMFKFSNGDARIIADLEARTATLSVVFSALLSVALIICRFF